MEDLEVNPLYEALLTKFRREFQIACKMSYLIVIPQSNSLEDNHIIDRRFVNSHILKPSRLLKMHYNQLQMGNFEDIEMENKKLICCKSSTRRSIEKLVVNIVAEEIGYNMSSREYRTLLVDQPLVSTIPPRQILFAFRGFLAPLSLRSPSALAKRQRAYLINARMLAHHDDCAKYLEFISQDLTIDLENEIKRLQANYIILSRYLSDAARRTRNIANCYIQKYELIVENSARGQFEVCDIIQKCIRLSVENYVVYLMRGKLMVTIQHCYERDDRRLADKFDLLMASKLTISQLGAHDEFSAFQPSDDMLRLLRRLPNLQSPLAMISCLINLIDLISENLNQSVRFQRLLGETNKEYHETEVERLLATSISMEPIPICSDDLIASFVYCLPLARPVNLFSALRYLEWFGWNSVEKEQASYYLATFESSVEYIMRFNHARPGGTS